MAAAILLICGISTSPFWGDTKWLSSADLKFLPSGSRQRIGWLYVAGILMLPGKGGEIQLTDALQMLADR